MGTKDNNTGGQLVSFLFILSVNDESRTSAPIPMPVKNRYAMRAFNILGTVPSAPFAPAEIMTEEHQPMFITDRGADRS